MSWMKDDKAIQDMVARRNPLNDESTRQENQIPLLKRILKAPLIYLRFAGFSENQARIIYYSLIGVGGYFAYKKFKR
tara:strand:+ start:6813 stop:7043 length:231 start_codon:yes stop_codon:yes gene_type:complete